MKTLLLPGKNLTIVFAAVALLSAGCLKQKDDTGGSGGGGNPPPTVIYEWPKIADSASKSLSFFWSAGGKYFLQSNTSSEWTNYWPNAHGLDLLVDAYLRTSNNALKTQMKDLIEGVKAKNNNTMINYYYDDMEWMALAALRAYKVTNDSYFLDVTNLLWDDIKGGWNEQLGGGIWWRKDNPSKNTPSNMPAAILAARLYQEFGDNSDLDWAKKIYAWQKSVLYEPTSGLVYDNIDKSGNKNTTWKFTYNQGTFLGAAFELYKITKESGYLNDARKAIDFTLNSGFLTSNGILKDEGGGDGGLFKGIFIRYFTQFILEANLDSGTKSSYINFMLKNAETLWSKGTNKSPVLFNSAWDQKPGSTVDFTVQASAVMLMEAMAQLDKASLLP